MPSPEVEEFARNLVMYVRDNAISACDLHFKQNAKGPRSLKWKSLFPNESEQERVKSIIPECVDQAIFYLLNAIDNGDLMLLYKTSKGVVVDLEIEGHREMAGWYCGPDSWQQQYSEERYEPLKFED